MKRKITVRLAGLVVVGLTGVLFGQSTVYKANNTNALNLASSWDGGVVPTSADIAAWDSRVAAGNAVSDVGGALTWAGLLFTNPGSVVTNNGTARLTLNGGAATDIDMSAATQDVVFNAPVTLTGSQLINVGAGRTLTFNGPTYLSSAGTMTNSGGGRVVFSGTTTNAVSCVYTAGETVFSGANRTTGLTSLQGGNVTVRGPFTSTSSDGESLAIYTGTLLLDGPSSALTHSGRLFAGRATAIVPSSDGLIIVSNGTHAVLGGDASQTSNFIGVSGATRGRLYVEGGSITFPYLRLAINNRAASGGLTDEIRVDGGRLSVTNVSSIAFIMGARHDLTANEASRDGRVEVNGGRFEVPNGTLLVSTDTGSTQAQTQTVYLAGGVMSVQKITVGSKANAVKRFLFNGGVLQATNVTAGAELIDGSSINATFALQSRGLLFDSGAYDVKLSRNLTQDPASATGAVYKLGSGTLTLSGTNTFGGPVIVSNGLLRVTGPMAVTNLLLAGGGFSMADGALTRFAPTGLKLGVPPNPGRVELEIAADGSDNDRLVLPATAWINQGSIALFVQGTRTPVSRVGDYPIMTYAGAAPSVAGLSWANPAIGMACTFDVNTVTKTVYAHVGYGAAPGFSMWIAPGSGGWATSANWNTAPGSASGTRVVFGEIATSPAAVTLDVPFTLGEMTFNNTNAFALSGAGSLTLDDGASTPFIAASNGAHTVALPISSGGTTPTFRADTGASLALNGAISGSAGLVKQGAGDVALGTANGYTGQTTIQNGTLSIQSAAAISANPVSLAGGKLRTTGAGPVSLSNTLVVATSGSALDASAPTEFTGLLDWAAGQNNFYKDGSSELVFKGAITESGNNALKLLVRGGSLRFANGANVSISHASRETFDLSASTTQPRLLAVETGAVVQVGGLYTGSGPSNTVYVNGGSLTCTGSGSPGESGLIRTVTDMPGTDRIIVDAGTLSFSDDDWLSLGVRGGDADIIVNGGTATFGRLSLGVRADAIFSSSSDTKAHVYVNGGVMDVVGALNWMGDINPPRTNQVFLNGGALRLPATFRSTSTTNRAEFTLNGGTLVLSGLGNNGGTSFTNYLSGLDALYVDQGGAVIDTLANAATITQTLQRVGATTGGLTKRGSGSLTLAAPPAYVGTTTVEAGKLALAPGAATTGLSVSNGATFSLANGTLETLALSSANLAAGARVELEVSTGSAACDQIGLPAGASVGNLVVALYNVGTSTTVTRADTFPIFSYVGTPPNVSGWTLAPECFGVTCTFAVNTGANTIDAQISYTASQVTWANSGAGNWSVAGNWWPQAPAASNAVTRFGSALAAPATVTVDGAVSVAGMIFDHTQRYILGGSDITLSNGSTDAVVRVAQGQHTIDSTLTLSGGTLASVAPGAELRVTALASGAGSLAVDGGGQLTLDGTNSTPMTVRGGSTVAVPDSRALGGAALTLDGGALKVSNTDAMAGTVTLGAGGGTVRGGAGQTLTLNATVGGSGGLTKAGAGTVALSSSALGYGGTTTSDGGTLSLAQLPSAGLVLGRGTLAYTGTSGSTAQPVTIASGTTAAVLRATGDLTLSGPITTTSGALFKTGTGTVSVTGAGVNLLGAFDSANQTSAAAIGADGDGPTAGFGALSVAQGRLTLGAAGQTNLIYGRLLVGLTTTADASAETAGEVVIADGTTVCTNWVGIGRSNGTTVTAPGGLSSRLLVQGGLFVGDSLSMGGASGFANYTGRPVLEIQNGGTCLFQNSMYINEAARGVSTVWVNGGTLQMAGTQQLRLGSTLGEGVLKVSSGTADIAKEVTLGVGGAGSTGTVELAGGTLLANNIIKGNSAGYARLTFNGGVFRPRLAGALTNLNVAQIGTNTLAFSSVMAYTGPTQVSNGVLRVWSSGALPSATALTVAPGARFALNNAGTKTVSLAGLTLGDASNLTPAELELGLAGTGTSNDMFAVAGTLTIGRAAVYLSLPGSSEPYYPDGTYTIATYTGAAPDTSAIAVANGRYGKSYTFNATGGVLSLTIGTASSGSHLWTAPAGGAWNTAGNWQDAPGAGGSGVAVRFDSAVTAPATVTLSDGVTLGAMHFNNTNAYTLSGAVQILADNGAAPALVSVEKGAHAVAAPVALTNGLTAKVVSGAKLTMANPVSGKGGLTKENAGILALAATNTYAGDTTLSFGEIALTNGATLGSGAVRVNDPSAVLSQSGAVPSVLTNELVLQQGQAQLNVGGRLELAGPVTWPVTSSFVKQGAGELTLSGRTLVTNDSSRVYHQEGTLRVTAGSDIRFGALVRDFYSMTADNNKSRSLVIDAGAKAAISGVYMQYGTNSVTVNGTLNLVGNNDAVCLRTTTQLLSQDPVDRLTVNAGGVLTASNAWVNVGIRGPGVMSVNGGTAIIGKGALGYQTNTGYSGKFGRLAVTGGGLLDISQTWNWMGDNLSSRVNNLTVSGTGTVVRLPTSVSASALGWSSFALSGATFVTLGGGTGTAADYLAGLKQLYVGAPGAVLDSAGQQSAITQPLCSDVSSNAVIVKQGLGYMAFTQPMAWPGLVDVRGGSLGGILTTGLSQTAGSGLLGRYSMEAGPVEDTSGNGRYGIHYGSKVTLGNGAAGSRYGLVMDGNTTVRVPYDSAMDNVTNFTIATWVWMDNYFAGFQTNSFFTTRLGSGSNGPYESMIRVAAGSNSRVRFMSTGVGSTFVSYDSTVDLPLSNWVHVAVVVNRQGVAIYQNGVQVRAPAEPTNTIRFSPARLAGLPGFAFGAYAMDQTGSMFQGRLDDVRVYSRDLSQAEVQEIMASRPVLPDLNVASGAAFVSLGASDVNNLTGEGVVNGSVTVRGSVAPGSATNAPAGAVLMADDLTFGTNTVYKWTWSPELSDELRTTRLTIAGAGVVDCGRDESDPVSGVFRTALMRYETITGASNLAGWTLKNVGRTGYKASIVADKGVVYLDFVAVRGTVLFLK